MNQNPLSDYFTGNWAPLLLPIKQNDTIDFVLLREQISILASTGINGIYSNGTAGEFYSQSLEEFEKIQFILAEVCQKAGIPFQIGASHMSAQESLIRIEIATKFQPAGIQLVLPDWFPVTLQESRLFLQKAEIVAKGVPLILYNPTHAKKILSPLDWKYLASECPGLKGIKVAGGDSEWYKIMRELFQQISVFIPGHFLASGMMQGAAGSYSNMACLSPKGTQAWYSQIVQGIQGDESMLEHALKTEQRVLSFLEDYIQPLLKAGYPNHACDKAMAVAGGWLGGFTTRLRFPYTAIPNEFGKKLGEFARRAIPEFFA